MCLTFKLFINSLESFTKCFERRRGNAAPWPRRGSLPAARRGDPYMPAGTTQEPVKSMLQLIAVGSEWRDQC